MLITESDVRVRATKTKREKKITKILNISATVTVHIKITKILNVSAIVTVHICTVTVAIMHLCTFLHPLIWVFFWPKCVNFRVFCILQDFAPTNVDALRVFKPYMTRS